MSSRMCTNCQSLIEILQIVEIEDRDIRNDGWRTHTHTYIYMYINGKISIDITCVGLASAHSSQ